MSAIDTYFEELDTEQLHSVVGGDPTVDSAIALAVALAAEAMR